MTATTAYRAFNSDEALMPMVPQLRYFTLEKLLKENNSAKK
jgi:hypothetical protein